MLLSSLRNGNDVDDDDDDPTSMHFLQERPHKTSCDLLQVVCNFFFLNRNFNETGNSSSERWANARCILVVDFSSWTVFRCSKPENKVELKSTCASSDYLLANRETFPIRQVKKRTSSIHRSVHCNECENLFTRSRLRHSKFPLLHLATTCWFIC